MTILLFDMDGVLLVAKAYHRALSETITLVGHALGYQEAGLTQEDIEVFKSVGVTSEWDSAAICYVLLLERVWKIFPTIDLPSDPPLPKMRTHGLQPPNFQTFFRSPAMADEPDVSSLLRAEHALLAEGNQFTETQMGIIRSILRGARTIHGSLTHRLFQEFVLGSDESRDSYNLEPYLGVKGYILTDDQSALTPEMCEKLLEWMAQPNCAAAVFTNRPSQAPKGYFDTPEAELGLKVSGLEGLPIVGHGGLAWLAEERGLDSESLLKPSPVHVLAALRRVLGDPLEQALRTSAKLVLDDEVDPLWQYLNGAMIYAIEDSIKGFRSAQNAQKVLAENGVRTDLRLFGISASETKQLALEAGGATAVFEDLNLGLNTIFEIEQLAAPWY